MACRAARYCVTPIGYTAPDGLPWPASHRCREIAPRGAAALDSSCASCGAAPGRRCTGERHRSDVAIDGVEFCAARVKGEA